MLRGSRSQGVSELGLDKISTYGILSEYTRDDLGDLFDQLESSGFIQQSGDRYPLVFLTDQGVRVMKGDESLRLAFPARLASSRTLIDRSEAGLGAPLKQREEARQGQDGADFNRAIFERLRRLRREIASELGVPAYRVFNDRTLKEMARIVPRSEAELLAISGVGEVTLERFGKRFLRVLEEEANGAGRG